MKNMASFIQDYMVLKLMACAISMYLAADRTQMEHMLQLFLGL